MHTLFLRFDLAEKSLDSIKIEVENLTLLTCIFLWLPKERLWRHACQNMDRKIEDN